MLSEVERADLKEEILREMGGYFAPSTIGDTVSSIDGWRKKVMGDGSFGRIFNGPQWLDNVAIRDGTITADKLNFGGGGLDYLQDNLIHFTVAGTEQALMEWKYSTWSAGAPYGYVGGSSAAGGALSNLQAYYDGTRFGSVYINTAATVQLVTAKAASGSTDTSIVLRGDDTTASSSIAATVGSRTIATLNYTNRNVQLYGRLYPGPDTGSPQTTRYISDDGTSTVVSSNLNVAGALLVPNGLMSYFGVNASGATGALPNPTKYIKFNDAAGTTAYYVPAYSAFNGWTA